jgi:hypothetical protein
MIQCVVDWAREDRCLPRRTPRHVAVHVLSGRSFGKLARQRQHWAADLWKIRLSDRQRHASKLIAYRWRVRERFERPGWSNATSSSLVSPGDARSQRTITILPLPQSGCPAYPSATNQTLRYITKGTIIHAPLLPPCPS